MFYLSFKNKWEEMTQVGRAVARALIGGGGGGRGSYSYIRVMPDEFLMKSVVLS